MIHKLENRIPPPVYLLFSIVVTYFIAKFEPLRISSQAARISGASVLVLIGILISLAGVLAFKRAHTTVNPLKPESASKLVDVGIFKFSRNPMYLGMLFVSVAAAFYVSSLLSLLGPVAFVICITRLQIIPEERAMLKLFGDSFLQYQTKVRRWL